MERFARVIMFGALCSVAFAFPNSALVSNGLPNQNSLVYPDHNTNDIYVVEFPENAPDWAIFSTYDELNSNNELNQNVDNLALDKAITGTDEIEVDNHQTEGSSSLSAKDLDQESLVPHRRQRRQANKMAMDFASIHTDRNGHDRPVFKPRIHFNMNQKVNDRNNFDASAGVSTVLFRSPNKQHSFGASVAVDKYQIPKFSGVPDVGFGVGYKWRF